MIEKLGKSMRHRGPSILWVVALLFCCSAAESATDAYGRTIYKAQHGAPDGWPGCFPDVEPSTDKAGKPVIDEKTGKQALRKKFPVWGHPELELYPGSVEHFRTKYVKYQPPISPFDEVSLIKNWKVEDLPGLKLTDFAEPIFYMPMYGFAQFTGRHRKPVKVLRLKRDGSNSVTVSLKKLKRGMYAVRLIAALPKPIADFSKTRPNSIIINCSINDGPNGTMRTYTRQHLAVGEFYGVGEWFFHAPDGHALKASISLDPESTDDLMVHNVDLHDALSRCPEKIIKSKASLHTAAMKQRARAARKKTKQGLWTGTALKEEERKTRDNFLWNAVPPEAMNLSAIKYGLNGYGCPDNARPPKEELAKIGGWVFKKAPVTDPLNWSLVNETLGLTYSREDYISAKPLPKPYPYPDRGWGVYIEKGLFRPVAEAMSAPGGPYTSTLWQIAYSHQWNYGPKMSYMATSYFNAGNLNAAWDAAILLCRQAYEGPSYINYYKRNVGFAYYDPGSNRRGLRRLNSQYVATRLRVLAFHYDMLFDFIKDNKDLAKAVGRFVPWIKTSKDLRAFLDSRTLMLTTRELINHNISTSITTPVMALEQAILNNNREANEPLMKYLFSQTFFYPLPLSGIQDLIITSETSDGTCTRGSFAYTQGGSQFMPLIDLSRRYIEDGGNPLYDLSDQRRFSKSLMGPYFALEGRVAGRWPLGIGDVGGIMPHGGKPTWLTSIRANFASGWKYHRDPKFAAILVNDYGRAEESDAEWAAILKAAEGQRDPWMAKESRVLPAWAGILEDGTEFDDHRLRRAATLRVGVGWGHSHRDTLDLQIFALGCQMTPDGGQRPGYGSPGCGATKVHNVVEVDNANWEGHAWIAALNDLPGSRVMRGQGMPTQKGVRRIERTIAMLNITPGAPAPDFAFPADYVFDVMRVSGGKRHTYCFHGAPGLEFSINATNPHPLAKYDAAKHTPDSDEAYMADYIIEDRKFAGTSQGTVVADWTLGREEFSFKAFRRGKLRDFRAQPPEQIMTGKQYDPKSPRKHTRLHLLNQEKARLVWGSAVTAHGAGGYGEQNMTLHAINDRSKTGESAFAAIIETYAGDTPAIRSVRGLPVAQERTDALRAVAVEVVTENGHRDYLVADGNPDGKREVRVDEKTSFTLSGRYGYLSTDTKGLRQATLAGGVSLSMPGVVRIAAGRPQYERTILTLDHLEKKITVAEALPALGPGFWLGGNDIHKTTVEVTSIAGKELTFRKGFELVSTRVASVDLDKKIVTGRLVSILMGTTEDNGLKPGMTDGLWATDEAMTDWWRCRYLGGTRDSGYQYELTGRDLTAKDFPISSAIKIFGLGAGDAVLLETFVSLRRLPAEPGVFEVQANVDMDLFLPKWIAEKGFECSADRQTWKSTQGKAVGQDWHVRIPLSALTNGKVYIRATKQ